jgi:hypothetical protein
MVQWVLEKELRRNSFSEFPPKTLHDTAGMPEGLGRRGRWWKENPLRSVTTSDLR